MPTKCVAVGCSNTHSVPGISLHRFPKCDKLRKLWVLALKRDRWEPTKTSVLCSAHFKAEDFVHDADIAASLPCKQLKRLLKPDALPSVFAHCKRGENVRPAFEKRRRMEIVNNALAASATASVGSSSAIIAAPESNPDICLDVCGNPAVSTSDDEYDQMDTNFTCSACGHSTTSKSSKYIQVDLPKATCNKGTLTGSLLRHCGVQTEESSLGMVERCSTPITDHVPDRYFPASYLGDSDSSSDASDESNSDSVSTDEINANDESFALSEASNTTGATTTDAVAETKYIVFESCLLELLGPCRTCLAQCTTEIRRSGSLVQATANCPFGHVWSWESQPSLHRKAIGNILLAGAILFTGSNPKKTLRLLSCIGVATPGEDLFFKIQKCVLFPSVQKVWNDAQDVHLSKVSQKPLSLTGDGRFDSPGFNAKYMTYTLNDAEQDIILHTELVQVNEVGNSVRMEVAGLSRGIKFLLGKKCNISRLVTDRHSAIRALVKKDYPDIVHLFDCWHMAKGIKKKLLAATKRRDTEVLGNWARAVVNHLYWSAASSDGHPEQIVPKWSSLTRHVVNVHQHESEVFPECAHDDLSEDGRLWLVEGSDAHRKLCEIVQAPPLLKDIAQLSTKEQTFGCEAFHSLINQFAPKTYHYSYAGMRARVRVAALHYNENHGRPQAVRADGQKRFARRFRKGRNGEASLSSLKVEPSYGYVRLLLEQALELCALQKTYKEALQASGGSEPSPPPTTAGREKPSKDELLASHRTRFNQC